MYVCVIMHIIVYNVNAPRVSSFTRLLSVDQFVTIINKRLPQLYYLHIYIYIYILYIFYTYYIYGLLTYC